MHQSIMLRYSVPQTSRHLKPAGYKTDGGSAEYSGAGGSQEDVLHHQVIHPEENEQLDNHTDAREEGKTNIKTGICEKKTNKETKRTGGNPVGGSFDMKI